MKHPIKMIVTDLDGTLLRTDKTISERTKEALAQCRRSGIKIVYATGRGGTSELLAPVELFDGRINMNGAIAKSGNTIVYNCLIPCKTARPVLIACDKRGMSVSSEISDMHYSNFNVSKLWPEITSYLIVDFSQHELDTEKIYTPNPTVEDKLFIEGLLPDELYFVETIDADGFIGQVMHIDATKGKATIALAKHWGIAQSEIVAFGDDMNDIDMLSYAGIGVAMENAFDEVKAVSNTICPSNDDDGIAEWIQSNLLR